MHKDSERLACQRCGGYPDDLWRCRVNLKVALLCPGCVADRRAQGHAVSVMGASE